MAIFTDEQLETYNQDKTFQTVWNKLEKWEQNRIAAISKGEPVPPVKEVNLTNKSKHIKATRNNSDDNTDTSNSNIDLENGDSSNGGGTNSGDGSQTSDGGSVSQPPSG